MSAPYQTSRQGPLGGGPQLPAEKPATRDTNSRVHHLGRLPLYPWGVGLYKPPRAPMQRVPNLLELASTLEKEES